MVVNSIDYGMNVAEATNRRVSTISGCRTSCVSKKGLAGYAQAAGSKRSESGAERGDGSTQSIMVGPDGELYGASDPARWMI